MRRILLAVILVCLVSSGVWAAGGLFPTDLPTSKWVQFKADGFSKPVSGIIFTDKQYPCCGVPIGGVATGVIDIDARGVFGFNALFNKVYTEDAFSGSKGNIFKTELTRKLPGYEPILGLSVGNSTWVLASSDILFGGKMETCGDPLFVAHKQYVNLPRVDSVKPAKSIRYWGHFPVADMEYETDAPVAVSLRAWSPFIVGDEQISNTPCAFFNVRLRNTTKTRQAGTLAFNFPGPAPKDASDTPDFARKPVEDARIRGIEVVGDSRGYAIGAIGESRIQFGGGLGRDGGRWSRIAGALPNAGPKDPGSSAAITFSLEPGQVKTVRFFVSWYAPEWQGKDQNRYTAMYARRFGSAADVALKTVPKHDSLLKRVLAWQREVYSDKKLPGWLKDTLVNNLALIAETSYWAQGKPPLGDWCYKGGFYGMLESPRGCPQIECIPCTWYGSVPVDYFFPELARSTIVAHQHYMREDNASPFIIGFWGRPDMASPGHEWQISLNGPCYVHLVDRLWQSTGDKAILLQFYDSVKKNTIFTMNLRPTPDGVISMPSDNRGMEWFEWGEWAGMCAHIGGLRLATCKIVERMAEAMGDKEFADQCRTWYANGSNAMENKLWAGSYYLNFLEEETGKKSAAVMAYQLDGEWAARFHGFDGVQQKDRVKIALETIRRCNMSKDGVGAINFANIDGKPLSPDEKVAEYGSYAMFVAEAMILGMTYMYAGEQEFGLVFVRQVMEQLVCVHRHPWDMPNMMYGDTGKRLFGTDYYQCLMLWSMPAAVYGEDLAGPCKKGGLVDRMIRAARSK